MTIPQDYFIFISVFIVAIYLLMMFLGYKKGFLYELINLLYTAFALAAAWFVSPVFSSLYPLVDISKIDASYAALNKVLNLNGTINTIIYFLIVFLLLKLLYFFLEILLKSFNKIPVLGKLNQVLGMLCGIVNATIITLCLSMLLSTPLIKNGKEVKEKTIFRYVSTYSDLAMRYIADRLTNNLKIDELDQFNVDDYREQFKEWLNSLDEHHE